MAKNIIIFQDSPGEDKTLLGFKILSPKATKQLMKAITLLSNAGGKFEFNEILVDYDIEKFDIIKATAGDLKVLSKLFNIEEEEETAGVFPDPLNDAYELGLISDDEDDEDFLEEYE